LHERDLPLEVVLLLGGGDAAVGELDGPGRPAVVFRRLPGDRDVSGEGFDVVQPLFARGANGFDDTGVGPPPECVDMDVEDSDGGVGLEPGHLDFFLIL